MIITNYIMPEENYGMHNFELRFHPDDYQCLICGLWKRYGIRKSVIYWRLSSEFRWNQRPIPKSCAEVMMNEALK